MESSLPVTEIENEEKKKIQVFRSHEIKKRYSSSIILPEGKICVVMCTEFFTELICMNIAQGNVYVLCL